MGCFNWSNNGRSPRSRPKYGERDQSLGGALGPGRKDWRLLPQRLQADGGENANAIQPSLVCISAPRDLKGELITACAARRLDGCRISSTGTREAHNNSTNNSNKRIDNNKQYQHIPNNTFTITKRQQTITQLVLTVSHQQMPERLLSLKASLRTLDLSVNKLSGLPPALGEFTLLKSLNLSSNRLSE